MKDESKTKKQLIKELLDLRLRNAELEVKETLGKQTGRVEKWTKDLFRDLVENTNDLIHTLAPDGRFIYANKAWLKTLGYQRKDIKNLSIEDIIHTESRKHCSNIFRHLISGREVGRFEAELITKKGRKLIVEVNSHCKFMNGKPVYIQCILHDITHRKRAEKALLASEKKYLDLYQNAPDGYHSIGSDGTILEVNNTWLTMLGYERAEVVNRMKLTDLLTAEGQKIFHETFPLLKKNRFMDSVEYYLRKKDGDLLPVLIKATAIYDENGNFIQTRTIVRDISARVSYRKKLEQTIEEWRITFDSMPYGVLLLDMSFRIERANKYFFSLYNISFEDIKNKECYEVIRSDRLKENFNNFSSSNIISLDTYEYYDEEVKKYFMVYMTPIPDAEGLTKHFVLALVDITEIKDKEQSLTDSRDAFFNMLKEVDFSYRELKGLYEGLIYSFVNAIDTKSPWTKGHSERVTNYALGIAWEMGLDSDVIGNLRIAALLHDIGKIGTYDVILDSPQKLSSEEIGLINLHPVKGEMILKPIKQLQHLLPIIRHHHERVDGQGYPDGLKGDEIPLLSRIICVADSFDSMTSDRPYRSAGTIEFAVSELKSCSNSQFDSTVVEAFIRVLDKK